MEERNTIQKTLVLEALYSLGNHPTADEVVAEVQKKYPSVSRATVYRILNQASESGTIVKVKINNGADHFDHQVFSHYHVRCISCGKVSDVLLDDNDVKLIPKSSSGYRITGYTLQFDGICPECSCQK